MSVNVGYSPHSAEDVLAYLDGFRNAIEGDDCLIKVENVACIARAQANDEVAIVFNLEDAAPLGGRLERLHQFHELGVRTLAPTFNYGNAVGGGCLDAADEGLTAYGRDLVAEMNIVGMVVDGSHCGPRSALELTTFSQHPMIYSHTGMRVVWDHPHNITDEQARECAATGGVIGIAGVGVFLGPNDATIEAMLRHIDYAVELVGAEHVGLATDYPIDEDGFNQELVDHPDLFPHSYTQWGPIRFMNPQTLSQVEQALLLNGYSPQATSAILGGNFRRVAEQVWSSRDTPR